MIIQKIRETNPKDHPEIDDEKNMKSGRSSQDSEGGSRRSRGLSVSSNQGNRGVSGSDSIIYKVICYNDYRLKGAKNAKHLFYFIDYSCVQTK